MASQPHLPRDTPAANADILGDEARYGGPPGDAAQPRGDSGGDAGAAGDGTRRGRRREPDGRPESGEARAGKDINQAGFLKDAGEGRP